jgi:hypothetical protein
MDTTTQLYKVIALANKEGYPDAADWISRNMVHPQTRKPLTGAACREKIDWIKNYRNEHGCTLKQAADAYHAQL